MTLVVSGIMAISHLYLGWRLTKASGFISKRSMIHWLPVIILLTFYSLPLTGLAIYGTQGHLDLLEIPKPITYWFWYGFVFSYQLLTWVIIFDVIKGGYYLWSKRDATSINTFYGRALFVLVAIVAVFSGFKLYQNTTVIKSENIELPVDNLPEELENLRIIHISDIQGDQYTGVEEINRYVEEVNAQHPDIIIFTGDLISYGTDFIEASAEALSKAKATNGIYAVVGDHDYWAGLSNVEPALESRGIPLLEDENRFIEIGSSRLLLTGITQVYSKRADSEEVKRLTSDSTHAVLKILAAHQVSDVLLDEAVSNSYHLFLAGHTHGGQVRVPLFGMRFSASDLETEFVNGAYRRENLLINVNNGLGFTLAPIRYNAPPTVTVIELRKK